jgi:hypothetical protein
LPPDLARCHARISWIIEHKSALQEVAVKIASSFYAAYTLRLTKQNGRFTGVRIYPPPIRDERGPLVDLIFVVLALGAFALFALAVDGCQRL